MIHKEDIPFSNLDRAVRLETAKQTEYDLLIIGGGITGCGIALDASLRGIKTLLIEKKDFASGTSSKSTKLIHGGLRYLKQFELGLVRETGTERAVAHANIPHLVHPESMLLPIVKGGTFSSLSANIAISVYDLLAGVQSKDRKQNLNLKATLEKVPFLNKELLKSGIKYSEFRTDDARLCIEIIKAARRNGAEAFNYLELKDFEISNGSISTLMCVDNLTDEAIHLNAKHIVNASGPWVDEVRALNDDAKHNSLHLTKGVHVVINKSRFPLETAVYFDAFDGRMIFAIPREKVVYIGTSDTTFTKDKDLVYCTQKDADYLLKALNNMFTGFDFNIEDIVSSWAGLRPLIKMEGKSPTDLSRKDEIFVSDTGLISIAGGKLTGFRKMAERIVDLICSEDDRFSEMSCKTKHFKIHVNSFQDYKAYKNFGKDLVQQNPSISASSIWYLINNYGKNASTILNKALSASNQDLEQAILIAELEFGIQHESVLSVEDFFERRTGMLYFDIERTKKYLKTVSDFLAQTFNWEVSKKEREYLGFEERIEMVSVFPVTV